MVYTQKDVNAYLRKINANDRDQYFVPLLAKRVIYRMLDVSLRYRYRREEQKAKRYRN